mmetsp:Transcript_33839/g.82020  ORF Transcript_33839/g.82020 Transcript_33839/m.82020 type:complete len:108 (+) Transcript_33839:360-683(+)
MKTFVTAVVEFPEDLKVSSIAKIRTNRRGGFFVFVKLIPGSTCQDLIDTMHDRLKSRHYTIPQSVEKIDGTNVADPKSTLVSALDMNEHNHVKVLCELDPPSCCSII